jgi:hypothetical protein
MANAEGPGANCPTSETNIGFIHLAPIMHWVKIKEVVKEQGGLRAAARHLKIKPSYLAALMDGTKKNPGDWYLRKLGLRRVTYIEET